MVTQKVLWTSCGCSSRAIKKMKTRTVLQPLSRRSSARTLELIQRRLCEPLYVISPQIVGSCSPQQKCRSASAPTKCDFERPSTRTEDSIKTNAPCICDKEIRLIGIFGKMVTLKKISFQSKTMETYDGFDCQHPNSRASSVSPLERATTVMTRGRTCSATAYQHIPE